MSPIRFLLAAALALPLAADAQRWQDKAAKAPPPAVEPSHAVKRPAFLAAQRPAAKAIQGPRPSFPLPAPVSGDRRRGWQIRRAPQGTPSYIDGIRRLGAGAAKTTATAAATAFFAENRDLFRLEDPAAELRLSEEKAGPDGATHLRYAQYHRGLPVWGADLVLHLRNGAPYAFNGNYRPSPRTDLPDTPGIDADEARAAAWEALGSPPRALPAWFTALEPAAETPRLCYWASGADEPLRLAWRVEVRPDWTQRRRYFVDALGGEVLQAYDNAPRDGAARAGALGLDGVRRTINTYEQDGTFYLIDTSRPIFDPLTPDPVNARRGTIVTLDARERDLTRRTDLFYVTSPDNVWDDPVAVAAHLNTGRVFDYFFATHGRRGLDGAGGNMVAIVHVTQDGRPMENAFWNGVFMAYGDGGRSFAPLAGALDVAAHEMTHGVIEKTVRLEYLFESGALNESLADVFAAMVDRDDWLIGEDVTNPGVFPSGALRDMRDPANGGRRGDFFWQPSHMDEFVELGIEVDNGGVHINSGIPNRACFLLAEAIGRDKTERVYYRVLDARYLNSRSDFAGMRLAAARAAADLFGEASDEVAAVHGAFAAVGIGEAAPAETPPGRGPAQGEQWVAVVNDEPGDNSLFLARPRIDGEGDIVRLSATQVHTRTGNPVSATDDGSALIFIDADNFIRAVSSDGQNEEVLSEEGIWGSIALSPDGRRLAATTVFEDSTLFVFDLDDPGANSVVHLYNPTTQEGVRAFVTLYADAMTWEHDGRFLVYDAFNSVPQADGPPIEFWNVNVLDVDSGIILPLFPAQPGGISIGNPALGRSNDSFLAFDLVDFNTDTSEIWVANLFTGDANPIESTGDAPGFPRFSYDDNSLVFERQGPAGTEVRPVALDARRSRALAPSAPYLSEAQRPVWFTIVEPADPTSVEEAQSGPTTLSLAQNYPNPFNSRTRIRYSLPKAGAVRLEVFDLLGRRVALLNEGRAAAGAHSVAWDGLDGSGRAAASGVYFYRLEAGDASLTRKLLLLR